MKRTNNFAIGFKDQSIIMELAIGCSSLWNVINYKRRQSFFNGDINWDYGDEYKAFAPNIGSATAQQIIRKNDEAWRSFFKLLELKRKGKLPPHIEKMCPPGYWKDRDKEEVIPRIIIRCDCYNINERTRIVKLPKKIAGKLRGNIRWSGKQGRLEIHYDEKRKKWYAHQSVETQALHQPLGQKTAYVDIGVKYPICALVEGQKQTIAFSGKPLLSDWWYWNGKIAEHQSILKTSNKKHKSKYLSMLYRKRKVRFRQAINTYVHRFAKYCWESGVSRVVAGDLTGIRNNGNKGRKTNAMINNFWSHNYLIERLRFTLENFGIALELIDERGTSSCCPWCGSIHITKRGRLFKCQSCKVEAHRDTVGTLNIRFVHGEHPCEGIANGVMAHPLVGNLFSFHSNTIEPPML